MVEKIKQLLVTVKQQYGPLKLFMLMKDGSDTEKWTIVVSADWLDRLSPTAATNIWISYLASVLDHQEQNRIGRISTLKTTDNFVGAITNMVSATGEPIELNKHIGNIFLNDVLVFESIKSERRASTRNRRTTWELNPYRNPSINPFRNPSINPFRNPSINPFRNPSINYYRNPTLNIYRNPSINPHLNRSILPSSRSFFGLHFYDSNLQKVGYLAEASDQAWVTFDLGNNFTGIAVKDSQNGFVLFDNNHEWKGQLVFAQEGIYLHYLSDNEHVGYAANF